MEAQDPTAPNRQPDHIAASVEAIAALHAEHARRSSRLQRFIDAMTARAGNPGFVVAVAAGVLVWVMINLAAPRPPDPPPFLLLELVGTTMALVSTLLILTTQRREDELAGRREQLTLQLALLNERKIAKIIALLEEMRRDSPQLRDRTDAEAAAMAAPDDAQGMIAAIRDEQSGRG